MNKPTAKTAPKAAPKPVTPAAQRKADEAGAVAETGAYIVGDCPIQHDGVLYQPGHEIALTTEQATRLRRHVTAIPAPKAGQPTTLE